MAKKKEEVNQYPIPPEIKGTGFFTLMDIPPVTHGGIVRDHTPFIEKDVPELFIPTAPINKITPDSWFIYCHYEKGDKRWFSASIEYKLADESNKKTHRFDTYAEAYKWIDNQVIL